jgi:hypothetical protein
MRLIRRFPFSIVILAVLAVSPVLGQPAAKPLAQRIAATDWSKVRGVNYIPSYGRNNYENWRDYSHEAFDTELRLARKVGYNSVRLWLNYAAYAENGRKMVDQVEDAIKLCNKHGLKAVIVLFDGCGVRTRPGARMMTIKDAYHYFLDSPRLSEQLKQFVKFNYEPYANGPGQDILIPVADDSSPHVMIWQYWQPSPGYDKMGEEWWPKLDSYVRAIVGRLAGNETVLAWDIMNEPEWSSEEPFTQGMKKPDVHNRVSKFLRHVRDVIKKNHPDEIVTAGFASFETCMEFEAIADTLTFHFYTDKPEGLLATMEKARAFGEKVGKPIFNTETLANFSFGPYNVEKLATDQGQLEHYQKLVPALLESRIGWMAWGLVVGRIFDSYCDIFYANGHPRPAAVYLERMLKSKPAELKATVK